MLELIKSGGWLMVPILLCSVVAMAIVVERFWTLRQSRIVPPDLVVQVWQWARSGDLDDDRIHKGRTSSPLGRVLAAALANRRAERDAMKSAIEEVGRHVVHELERYLNALGTIAAITPLLGLLGTVIGMIKVFTAITVRGSAIQRYWPRAFPSPDNHRHRIVGCNPCVTVSPAFSAPSR